MQVTNKQSQSARKGKVSIAVVVLIKVAMVNILWLCGDSGDRIAVGDGW